MSNEVKVAPGSINTRLRIFFPSVDTTGASRILKIASKVPFARRPPVGFPENQSCLNPSCPLGKPIIAFADALANLLQCSFLWWSWPTTPAPSLSSHPMYGPLSFFIVVLDHVTPGLVVASG